MIECLSKQFPRVRSSGTGSYVFGGWCISTCKTLICPIALLDLCIACSLANCGDAGTCGGLERFDCRATLSENTCTTEQASKSIVDYFLLVGWVGSLLAPFCSLLAPFRYPHAIIIHLLVSSSFIFVFVILFC